MSEELVEKVAQSMYESVYIGTNEKPWSLLPKSLVIGWMVPARAALAAIEASGTHCVVPTLATFSMLAALGAGMVQGPIVYARCIDARPRTGETP